MKNRSFMSNGINVKNVEPCGYYVLVELLKAEEKSAGGIVMVAQETNREQAAMPLAKVHAIGPQAFKNMESGCNSAQEWGFDIGDVVQISPHEYQRVAGKEDSQLVYVLDHSIKGKVNIDE